MHFHKDKKGITYYFTYIIRNYFVINDLTADIQCSNPRNNTQEKTFSDFSIARFKKLGMTPLRQQNVLQWLTLCFFGTFSFRTQINFHSKWAWFCTHKGFIYRHLT